MISAFSVVVNSGFVLFRRMLSPFQIDAVGVVNDAIEDRVRDGERLSVQSSDLRPSVVCAT